MDQDEKKQDSQSEIEKLTTTLSQVSGELNSIKASIQKRKSETTTLKILFYTGLAVLLVGFIYTNQTLQRAQSRNLETNIVTLQNSINHNQELDTAHSLLARQQGRPRHFLYA